MTEHKCPYPATVAADHLKGREHQAILTKLKIKSFADAGDMLLFAIVWQFENRHAPTTYESILEWETTEIMGYFAPEPTEDDETATFHGSGETPGSGNDGVADSDE